MRKIIRNILPAIFLFLTVLAARAQDIPLSGPIITPSTGTSNTGSTTVNFTSDANCNVVTATNCAVTGSVYHGGYLVTGAISAQRNVQTITPTQQNRSFVVTNATTGGFGVQLIGASGTGCVVANGATVPVVWDGTNYACAGGAGAALSVQTAGTPNSSQAVLNHTASSANATGLALTPTNPSGGIEKYEASGTVNTTSGGTGQNTSASTGVAQVSSGTWSVSTALPSTTSLTNNTLQNTYTSGISLGDSQEQLQHGQWPTQLWNALGIAGGSQKRYAIPSSSLPDVFSCGTGCSETQAYPVTFPLGITTNTNSSLNMGYNDCSNTSACTSGNTPSQLQLGYFYGQYFAWGLLLSTPDSQKLTATANCTTAGTWTSLTAPFPSGSLQSTVNGSTLTCILPNASDAGMIDWRSTADTTSTHTITVTQGGVSYSVTDPYNAGTTTLSQTGYYTTALGGTNNLYAEGIPGLPGGYTTIVYTCVNATGSFPCKVAAPYAVTQSSSPQNQPAFLGYLFTRDASNGTSGVGHHTDANTDLFQNQIRLAVKRLHDAGLNAKVFDANANPNGFNPNLAAQNGQVNQISISAGGSGYANGNYTVTGCSGGTYGTPSGTATVVSGVISTGTIFNTLGGTCPTSSGLAVVFSGGGTGAAATAVWVNDGTHPNGAAGTNIANVAYAALNSAVSISDRDSYTNSTLSLTSTVDGHGRRVVNTSSADGTPLGTAYAGPVSGSNISSGSMTITANGSYGIAQWLASTTGSDRGVVNAYCMVSYPDVPGTNRAAAMTLAVSAWYGTPTASIIMIHVLSHTEVTPASPTFGTPVFASDGGGDLILDIPITNYVSGTETISATCITPTASQSPLMFAGSAGSVPLANSPTIAMDGFGNVNSSSGSSTLNLNYPTMTATTQFLGTGGATSGNSPFNAGTPANSQYPLFCIYCAPGSSFWMGHGTTTAGTFAVVQVSGNPTYAHYIGTSGLPNSATSPTNSAQMFWSNGMAQRSGSSYGWSSSSTGAGTGNTALSQQTGLSGSTAGTVCADTSTIGNCAGTFKAVHINGTTDLAVAGGTAMTGNQGTGVKLQHSTGSPTSTGIATFDATGNVVDGSGGNASLDASGNLSANGFGSFSSISIGRKSAVAWGTAGLEIIVPSAGLNDTSSSGTVASNMAIGINTPTLTANSATTYTNAGTVYIAGPPTASTNVTITNPFSLYVAAGANFFGGTIAAASGSTVNGSPICTTANGACSGGGTVTTSGSPASTYLAGFSSATAITGTSAATINSTGDVTLHSIAINGGTAITGQTGTGGTAVVSASPALTGSPTAPTQTALDNSTKLATTAYVDNAVQAQQLYSDIQGVLFSTSTMLGPVFYEPKNAILNIFMARLSGTISCAVAPHVQLLDLGTSPTTAFGGATAISNLATGTSDGAYTTGTGLAVGITAGHYYGFAFDSGTCVTAPAFDLTAQIQ